MFGVSEGGWTNALQLEAAAPQETLDMHAHVASEESCVTFHSRDFTTLALQQRLAWSNYFRLASYQWPNRI